ncbi:MAG: YhjD/YihY/BrkB family envelope integrity protein [Myxococcota bacterium]
MTLRQAMQRGRRFLLEELWDPAFRSQRRSSGLLDRALGLLQFAVMTAEGFVRDQLLLRATALSFFTVLSLIPIIAIVVAIAGAIGIDSQFEKQIVESIAAGAPETQALIIDLIRNARFSALGGMGAAVLLVTTVMGISNVERAFNSIWGVKRARSLGRRFPDYLAILMVVPLLATGLSIATGLKSQWLVQRLLAFPLFERFYDVGLQQLPWLVLSLAFALMFWFLPNTRVRFASAALGGMVSGVLVLWAQGAYVKYSVGVARADVLFGTFAQLPLLFFWIYIFWAIVLFGAEVAFAHQHLASYRSEVKGARAGPAEREAAALRVAIEVAEAFRDAAVPPTAVALSEALRLPVRTVRDIADHLERAGILSERATPEGEAYSLGQPAERIRVVDVLAALRGERECNGETDAIVEGVLAELDSVVSHGPGGRSIAELMGVAAEPVDESGQGPDRRIGIA